MRPATQTRCAHETIPQPSPSFALIPPLHPLPNPHLSLTLILVATTMDDDGFNEAPDPQSASSASACTARLSGLLPRPEIPVRPLLGRRRQGAGQPGLPPRAGGEPRALLGPAAASDV